MSRTSFFTELRRRRIPQALSLYLGASWAILQFVDWIVQRYFLAPAWTDATLLAVASLLPAILMLAWEHGASGRQAWGRAGRLGLPANLVLTTVLLAAFLHGRDLSAAAKTVTVNDEDGQEVSRLVARSDARRKLALFFWTNETDDPALDWLRYGLPFLVARDLGQNDFADVWTPFYGYQFPIHARLRRAGVDDGLDPPLALIRRITEDWRLGHFATGRLQRSSDGRGLRGTLELYETSDVSAAPREILAEGATIHQLVDALTEAMSEELDLPSGGDQLTPDRPLADHTSADESALEALISAQVALMLRNDLEAANAALLRATEIDPGFALAHARRSDLVVSMGDAEEGGRACREALRHDYRLTDADRFNAKALRYALDGQPEKAIAVFEMWVDLHPDDTQPKAQLANAYRWIGNRVEDSLQTYEAIYREHPEETWALRQAAQMAQLLGRDETARDHLARFADLHPDDHSVLLELGKLHQANGDFAAARTAFDRASLMATGMVSPALALADLDLLEGDMAAARARLGEAEEIAADSQQRALVIRQRILFHSVRGEIDDAVALLDPLRTEEEAFKNPLDIAIGVDGVHAEILVANGQGADLRQRLDAWKAQMGPTLDGFLEIGYLALAVERGDVPAIQKHSTRLQEIMDRFQRTDFAFLVLWGEGHQKLLAGDHVGAADAFERALQSLEGSVQSLGGDRGRADMEIEIGRAYRLADQLDLAEDHLGRALRLVPAEPEGLLELSRVAEARGNREDAVRHLDAALEIWRDADEDYDLARQARVLRESLGGAA